MAWPVLVFDIESIPDIAGLRLLRSDPEHVTDQSMRPHWSLIKHLIGRRGVQQNGVQRLGNGVVQFTGESSKGKAVNKALAEFVRRRKLDDLAGMIGSMGLNYDWRKERQKELADSDVRYRD